MLRRLMAIYIIFLIVLGIGFVHGFSIKFIKGFTVGAEMGAQMANRWEAGNKSYTFNFNSIPTQAVYDTLQTTSNDPSIENIRVCTEEIDLQVQKISHSDSPIAAAFRVIGDNSSLYISMIIFLLSRLAIIILMAVIINSLRKSIRDEQTLSPHNILYSRIIGGLIIFSELLLSTVNWIQQCNAAQLLEGSSIIVNPSFPISYWNLMMGILIIFTAEVFAIGQQLSEEQKYTI